MALVSALRAFDFGTWCFLRCSNWMCLRCVLSSSSPTLQCSSVLQRYSACLLMPVCDLFVDPSEWHRCCSLVVCFYFWSTVWISIGAFSCHTSELDKCVMHIFLTDTFSLLQLNPIENLIASENYRCGKSVDEKNIFKMANCLWVSTLNIFRRDSIAARQYYHCCVTQ